MNRTMRHGPAPRPPLTGWIVRLVARLDRTFGQASRGAIQRPPARVDLVRPLPAKPQVLVVDDDPTHREDAIDLLGRWGIAPMLAADGEEAVALARMHRFDLILMDLQMPVLDGLGATKQIRLDEQRRSGARTPVLAYSSLPLEGNLLRACGLDGVLDKPCSARALRDCLLRWCLVERIPQSSP